MKSNEKSNKKFWGPSDELLKYDGIILDFCKVDLVGKAADWLSPQDKSTSQRTNNADYDASVEDTDNYNLAFQTRIPKTNTRTRFRVNYSRNRSSTTQRVSYRARGGYNRGRRSNFTGRGRYGVDRYHQNQWFRKPSVVVGDQWKLIEEIPYQQLTKLNISQLPQVTNYREAGSVLVYDKSYDNIRPKEAKPLVPSNFVYHKVCTCEDPIIREGISTARVFGTDTVISTLMAASRSIAPWDIIIHRVSNLLFFDKRSASDIELHTVSETSTEPGYDTQLNSPTALSLEASTVNQHYSQQCLLKQISKVSYGKNPFFVDQESPEMPSVAYRYRLFDLGDDLKVLVRCEFDAYSVQDKSGINVKTLLEWGTKPAMQNWRSEFENFSGSTLASEIKNNSAKVTKWTSSAIMAGDNIMKIGFVTRNHYTNNKDHSIIGSLTVHSQDLANQIGLNMNNAWGIIYSLSKRFLELPEGKYLLLKDPFKPLLRLYSVPDSDLNSDDDGNDDDDNLSESKDFNDQDINLDDLY